MCWRGCRNDDEVDTAVVENLKLYKTPLSMLCADVIIRFYYLADAQRKDNLGRRDSVGDQRVFCLLHVFVDNPEQFDVPAANDVAVVDASCASESEQSDPESVSEVGARTGN